MGRIATAVVAGVLALATMVQAEDVERRALAEQLLEGMHMQETIEESFAMVKQMMPAQMKQMGFSDAASSGQA